MEQSKSILNRYAIQTSIEKIAVRRRKTSSSRYSIPPYKFNASSIWQRKVPNLAFLSPHAIPQLPAPKPNYRPHPDQCPVPALPHPNRLLSETGWWWRWAIGGRRREMDLPGGGWRKRGISEGQCHRLHPCPSATAYLLRARPPPPLPLPHPPATSIRIEPWRVKVERGERMRRWPPRHSAVGHLRPPLAPLLRLLRRRPSSPTAARALLDCAPSAAPPTVPPCRSALVLPILSAVEERERWGDYFLEL